MGREVYRFKKNSMETLRVQVGKFNGHPVVDLRVWFTDDEGDLRPTKKGLTVGPKALDDLAVGIQAARAFLAGDLAQDPDMGALQGEAREVDPARLIDYLSTEEELEAKIAKSRSTGEDATVERVPRR